MNLLALVLDYKTWIATPFVLWVLWDLARVVRELFKPIDEEPYDPQEQKRKR